MQATEVVKPLRPGPGGDVLDNRACNWGANLVRGHIGMEQSLLEDTNGVLSRATAVIFAG